ncbi:MAG: ATP-dependent DNA ligase [Acidimicrobiia bacterium]|nr:ATP-dependent DNA ligase [Acidimicrobiia bacterium]
MGVLFDELAAASEQARETSERNLKVAAFAAVLGRLGPDEIEPTVAFLTGTTRLGRIGVGWATLADVRPRSATEPTLTVAEVDRAIVEIAAMGGAGVVALRRERLSGLSSVMTAREQRLLFAVLGGELRQGAQEGVMTTAVAKAAGVPVGAVRRGAMMAGDLGVAARVALADGRTALDAISIAALRPVQPMLASSAADVAEVLGGGGPASVEWKLDGARIQAHRQGNEVALFTRNLNDVTERLPGVVSVVRGLPGGDLVLDGEAMGMLDGGSPRRFQDTMADFGADDSTGRGSGLRAFFFDIMMADGSAVHDQPLSVRRALLAETVPSAARLPSIVTADPAVAARFLEQAVASGHEGVMVKGLDQPYAAGRRGAAWRKVKPVHTFVLVVLAVEWGHGRRTGWLSNLHLGARDLDGGFVMVGKTFKGMTDEILRWQTERFLGLEIGREGHVVHVEPVQVVEIAVDGVQRSTRYPGGVALRFARVRRYREDKSAAAGDDIDVVRRLL